MIEPTDGLSRPPEPGDVLFVDNGYIVCPGLVDLSARLLPSRMYVGPLYVVGAWDIEDKGRSWIMRAHVIGRNRIETSLLIVMKDKALTDAWLKKEFDEIMSAP